MRSEFEIKREICEIGKRIYDKGFVAANDGNITVKVNDNEFWATPTGVSKGYMTPDMLIKVDGKGNVLEGKLRPSSELRMHLRVYRERPDVGAVVHAHPPTATGFAIAGVPLNKFTMPEAIIFLGPVPLAKYGTPSTDEIPDAISEHLQVADALLLENHGALTVGVDLNTAFFKMDTLEFYAKLSLVARQLGGEKELSCQQIDRLMELRKEFKVPGRHSGCPTCSIEPFGGPIPEITPAAKPASNDVDVATLVAEVTKRVLQQMGK